VKPIKTGTRVTFDVGDGKRRLGTVHQLIGDDVVIREHQEPHGTVVMPQSKVSVEDGSE
jgi:hypothetical protein